MPKFRNKVMDQDVYFTKNSIVKVPRSTFFRSQDHKTTFNMGELVPFYVDEVLPGDTRSIDLSSVIRVLSPFVKPVMDDLRFEAWAFFVPARLCDKNWEHLIGGFQENPDWTIDPEVSALNVVFNGTPDGKTSQTFGSGTVADHMGLPILTPAAGTVGYEINRYPFIAYALIWNYWFRDENLQNSIPIDYINQTVQYIGDYDNDALLGAQYGGKLLSIARVHDYFSSALPQAQKGAEVNIGITGTAPVMTTKGASLPVFGTGKALSLYDGTNVGGPREWSGHGLLGNQSVYGLNVGTASSGGTELTGDKVVGVPTKQWFDDTANNYENTGLVAPLDALQGTIYTDLSDATAIPINDLRLAFQLQLIKEADARGGTRYKEMLRAHFGVISSDARLQYPEYLGSFKMPLNINQVVQTNAPAATTNDGAGALGNTSAYSVSADKGHFFTKSFTEHGYIIIVGGVRQPARTYSQGINKMWSRKTRFDWYTPELAHIGEQPVNTNEIFANTEVRDNTWGYQEAWAEYRYLPNLATGYMRPDIDTNLSVFHFGDSYASIPTLSGEWIQEGTTNLDRTLAIPSDLACQFVADFYIKDMATRPMPLHSVPGLIDHGGKIII